jgi:hypothetical protein
MTFGFVIVRHVNDSITNEYWKESYKCIRKFYDNPILIIDDNSNPDFLIQDIELVNCQVIQSEYPRAAEILGYYYFHKLKPFDKAIIIHDSVFINQYIKFEDIPDVKFLWSFTHQWDSDKETILLMLYLDNSDELIRMYSDKSKWLGCFGIMSVITWDIVDRINRRYNLFSALLPIIKTRHNRECLERLFACVCYLHSISLQPNPHLLCNIHAYCPWGRTFEQYKHGDLSYLPVIKVWTGR